MAMLNNQRVYIYIYIYIYTGNIYLTFGGQTQDVTLNDLELDGCLRISADGQLPKKVVRR